MADEQKNKDQNKDAQDFQGILDRLQEIATQVEGEDTALETSMDLLSEAVELGTRATQIIDDENLSEEEKQKLQEMLNDEAGSVDSDDLDDTDASGDSDAPDDTDASGDSVAPDAANDLADSDAPDTPQAPDASEA